MRVLETEVLCLCNTGSTATFLAARFIPDSGYVGNGRQDRAKDRLQTTLSEYPPRAKEHEPANTLEPWALSQTPRDQPNFLPPSKSQ
ncbi:hypothetical protein Y1Q_0009686 [Alligator mississippiensis]|uniref:Uncharacterized protein n=1 Tax=Alligator mississippiensis TaxID=8496 RepID=A0A151MWG0_ALLMI|nr:hypothetical protein Y1Q_0009686 [Alligator mississippiensis]